MCLSYSQLLVGSIRDGLIQQRSQIHHFLSFEGHRMFILLRDVLINCKPQGLLPLLPSRHLRCHPDSCGGNATLAVLGCLAVVVLP